MMNTAIPVSIKILGSSWFMIYFFVSWPGGKCQCSQHIHTLLHNQQLPLFNVSKSRYYCAISKTELTQ
jgi:hypothetical protein